MDVAAGRNISFPRYAEYNCAFRYIVEQALGARFVMPPALTKRGRPGPWGRSRSSDSTRR